MKKQKILICGGGGFIGSHLAKYFREQGHEVWTAGVELVMAGEYRRHITADLTNYVEAKSLLEHGFDEVYQLAADMGGIGYLADHSSQIMLTNATINLNVLKAALRVDVKRYFFASSVCIYPDSLALATEDDAIPAQPTNGYAWEKLFTEQLLLETSKTTDMQIRIGRFDTVYGVGNSFVGGREKVIGALCRKIAESTDTLEIWGDGTAVRSFIHVDDLVRGIDAVMHSTEKRPVNIGTDAYVTVADLAKLLIAISGKSLKIKPVEGAVGVLGRNFSHARLHDLGFKPTVILGEGLKKTYEWIARQINNKRYSVCCSATAVYSADLGDAYYLCANCKKPCDVVA